MHGLKMPKMLFALLTWLPLCSLANMNVPAAQPLPPKATLAQIRALIKADRLPEAASAIAIQLQQRPDSELQFLQCVVQANQKQVPQAIGCFTALVKLHPDMVEAYNNLGVLHASLGRHEEAKQWFDNGLRRVPALWTVHQNILNLQADLSRKAYSRALQMEVPVREPQAKLSFLAATSSVLLASTATQDIKAASQSGTKVPVQAPSSAPVQSPSSAPVTATAPVQPVLPPRLATTPAPAAAGAMLSVKPTSPASISPEVKLDENHVQVQQAVEAWAKAWSDKNLSSYFGAYSSRFTPGKGVAHADWKVERTARIAGRQFIRVAVSNVTFEKKSPNITVRLTQTYESDNLLSSNRKRLDFALEDGRWKIVRETVIGQTP